MKPSLSRRPSSPAVEPPPLENDDLLDKILIRLPPLPSSLPRASAVCKRWRGLVSTPASSAASVHTTAATIPSPASSSEENNVVLLRTSIGIFTVQLESLQFKKLSQPNFWHSYYPFEGVYTAGI
ncbi:hypothetical protein QYE76_021361 [Lolium multiflorum]|uniref:F-box domain-containing protein n=1 Tax=Lolium multiflorum TaxID=4521 RepID=A0AAD8VQU6_LOLMU|nr:hypothetical protein QYE76_021361 [Lolium multiflorum]